MNKFWKIAIGAGGFGSVGAFLFWSLYKQWLTLPIFSQLTSQQTYELMMLFLILTFLAFIVSVCAYLFNDKKNVKINDKSANHETGLLKQLVRWGPVDGKGAGIYISTPDDLNKEFIPWSTLLQEITIKLIPQLEYVPQGCSVSLSDYKGKKDWIVRINNVQGDEIGNIWFGPDPNKLWSYDGLIRIGVPGSPPLVWQIFQRYSDGSYRGI